MSAVNHIVRQQEAARARARQQATQVAATQIPEGCYLTGLPVGVAIDTDGKVTLTVYAEDLGVALSEDDATPEHIAAVEAFLTTFGTAHTVTPTTTA